MATAKQVAASKRNLAKARAAKRHGTFKATRTATRKAAIDKRWGKGMWSKLQTKRKSDKMFGIKRGAFAITQQYYNSPAAAGRGASFVASQQVRKRRALGRKGK